MKLLSIIIFFIFIAGCSLNKDSKYWTEDVVKRQNDKKELSLILEKSEDITNMTIEEYEIYIDDYSKKSKYSNLSQ